MFTVGAKRFYMEEEGMTEEDAEARALSERWTSHCGRRGATTESLRLLMEYEKENPGTVPLNYEKLVNIHMKWADGDATSQDLYTGLAQIEVLCLLTYVM